MKFYYSAHELRCKDFWRHWWTDAKHLGCSPLECHRSQGIRVSLGLGGFLQKQISLNIQEGWYVAYRLQEVLVLESSFGWGPLVDLFLWSCERFFICSTFCYPPWTKQSSVLLTDDRNCLWVWYPGGGCGLFGGKYFLSISPLKISYVLDTQSQHYGLGYGIQWLRQGWIQYFLVKMIFLSHLWF